MEVSQGKSLCSHLKKVKPPFFLFLFFNTKSENRRAEQVLARRWGWYQWEGGGDGERVKKGEYDTNTVYIYM
jgi:hypothetical protein